MKSYDASARPSARPSTSLYEFEGSLKDVQSALHGRELVRLTIAVAGRCDQGVDRDVAQKLLKPFHALARETEKAILQSRGEKSYAAAAAAAGRIEGRSGILTGRARHE